jgi:hypothetical protein
MKNLTILFLLIAGMASAQSAIIFGRDTLRGSEISISPTYTSIDGKKLITEQVDEILVDGQWLSRPDYFKSMAGQGDLHALMAMSDAELAGQSLIQAGKRGELSIGILILGGLVGAIIGGDGGLIIGGAAFITSAILQMTAWGQVRESGQYLTKIR